MLKELKVFFQKVINFFGLKIVRVNHKPDPVRLWEDDEKFRRLFSSIKNKTLLKADRAFMLYQLLNQSLVINGDVAEVGVFKGGTAKLVAEIINGRDKNLFLFDTFRGMPKTDSSIDKHQEGDFSGFSLAEVKSFVGESPNIFFVEGFFPDTAGIAEGRTFSFVHIDADIYRSVKDCCDFFLPAYGQRRNYAF